MSASAVYVLDLKGKVPRAPNPPRCQATGGGLAPRGPTLLLGNRPMGATLVLGKEAVWPHLRTPPFAGYPGRGLRSARPALLLGNAVGCRSCQITGCTTLIPTSVGWGF